MSGFGNIQDDTFIGDSDTPSLYTGSALKLARVNAGETALEFVTIGVIGGGTFLRLDASNDPMTGALDMGDNSISNINHLYVNGHASIGADATVSTSATCKDSHRNRYKC